MPFYENGDVRIHYEEAGSGFPLLRSPGGGLNSNMGVWTASGPFDAMSEFKDSYRCITMDQRNANTGESTGPVQVENPWDAFADDQLGLMSYLGCEQFMAVGFCIGGPFLLKLIERAPGRVVAAVLAQPVGHGTAVPWAAGLDLAADGVVPFVARDGFRSDPIEVWGGDHLDLVIMSQG